MYSWLMIPIWVAKAKKQQRCVKTQGLKTACISDRRLGWGGGCIEPTFVADIVAASRSCTNWEIFRVLAFSLGTKTCHLFCVGQNTNDNLWQFYLSLFCQSVSENYVVAHRSTTNTKTILFEKPHHWKPYTYRARTVLNIEFLKAEVLCFFVSTTCQAVSMERRIHKCANLYRPGVHGYYAVTQISEQSCPGLSHCPNKVQLLLVLTAWYFFGKKPDCDLKAKGKCKMVQHICIHSIAWMRLATCS